MGNKSLNTKNNKEVQLLKNKYLELLRVQKLYLQDISTQNKKIIHKFEHKITLLNNELNEYRGFKRGKIWKYLVLYRKFKSSFIHSLQSIQNPFDRNKENKKN